MHDFGTGSSCSLTRPCWPWTRDTTYCRQSGASYRSRMKTGTPNALLMTIYCRSAGNGAWSCVTAGCRERWLTALFFFNAENSSWRSEETQYSCSISIRQYIITVWLAAVAQAPAPLAHPRFTLLHQSCASVPGSRASTCVF